jgi:hypothetical protein
MSSGLSGPRTSLATGHASLVRMRWAMTYSMGSCITCAFVARVTARAQSRDVTITFLRDPARLLRVLYVWGLSSLCLCCPSVFGSVFRSFRLSSHESRIWSAVRCRGEALGIRGARMAREMRAEKRQPRLVLESTLHILPRFTFNLGLADVQVRPEPEPERSCDRLRVSRRHDPSRSPLGLRPLVEAPWMCGEWEGWD